MKRSFLIRKKKRKKKDIIDIKERLKIFSLALEADEEEGKS